MTKARQSIGWWSFRILGGCCPVHGYKLVPVAEFKEGYVVRCPREDCQHSAIQVQRGDPLDRALNGANVVLRSA